MAKELDVSVILGSNDFYKAFNKDSILSREVERETMIKASKGDVKAQNLLVTANLGFANFCASNQAFSNIDYDDLLEECILGLVKASRNIKEKYCKQKFITYAYYYIIESINNGMCSNTQFKISNIKFRMMKKVVSVYEHLSSELDSEAECKKQTALFFNISEEEVMNYLYLSKKLISLESTHSYKNDNEPIPLSEMIEDNKVKTPEEEYISNLKTQTVDKLMNSLSERERNIITKHLGLYGDKKVSMANIGMEYGISRQAVYNIEKGAKKYLKENYKEDLEVLSA